MMRGKRAGGLLAGLGFMLPGLLLILGITWLYQRLDLRQPDIAAVFMGIQIAVIALIARAVHRIIDHTLNDPWLWTIAAASAACAALGVSFWITLPVAGCTYAAVTTGRFVLAAVITVAAATLAVWIGGNPFMVPSSTVAQANAGRVDAIALFLSGMKAGLLTFGGAYTAIPFVRDDAVGRGWISEAQFLDGLALSGIILAPLIIFATFVGYIAGGPVGGLAMTAGIFLPAFAFGLIFYDRLEALVEDKRLHRFLEGVAAGVAGMIAVTAMQLGWSVSESVPSLSVGAGLFAAALAVLYLWRSKISVPVVFFGSAVSGALILR
jgi:chromate transporter